MQHYNIKTSYFTVYSCNITSYEPFFGDSLSPKTLFLMGKLLKKCIHSLTLLEMKKMQVKSEGNCCASSQSCTYQGALVWPWSSLLVGPSTFYSTLFVGPTAMSAHSPPWNGTWSSLVPLSSLRNYSPTWTPLLESLSLEPSPLSATVHSYGSSPFARAALRACPMGRFRFGRKLRGFAQSSMRSGWLLSLLEGIIWS